MTKDKSVYDHNDVSSSILTVIKDIQSLSVVDTAMSHSTKSTKSHVDKLIQVLLKKKYDESIKNSILEIIVSHCVLAEKLCPGSFKTAIQSLSAIFSDITNGKSLPEFQNYSVIGSRPSFQDVLRLTYSDIINDDAFTAELLREILDVSGFGTKVIVEKSSNHITSIERIGGYTFQISPAWEITTKLEQATIIVIDGYVESVSEIHHLLEAASSTKQNIVMFARGLSDDVLNTLSVNYHRGTLTVIPFIVKFDLDSVNVLNDIAIVCGTDVISCNKGQLISSIKLDDMSTIKNLLVYRDKFVITNDSTRQAVKSHIEFLKSKKIELKSTDEINQFYDKRISSLSGNRVVLRLPDDSLYVKRSQMLDEALRKMKAIIEYGVSNNGEQIAIRNLAVDFYTNKCAQILTSIGCYIDNR